MDPVDLDEFSDNGMVFEEFDDPKIGSDGRFLTVKANMFTKSAEVAESPSNYCLDRIDDMYSDRDKGLFVAFQVAIKGTGQQHDIRPNGIAAKKWRERERLQRGIASAAASPNRLVALQLPMRPVPTHKSACLGAWLGSARLGSARLLGEEWGRQH